MPSLPSILKGIRSSDSTIKNQSDAVPSSGSAPDTSQASSEPEPPRTIYKPVHAARDAAMSVPVDERKATLEMLARFRNLDGQRVNWEGSHVTSAVKQREDVEPQYFGRGKGKGRASDGSIDPRDFARHYAESQQRAKADSVMKPETSKRKRGSSSRCSEVRLLEDEEETETEDGLAGKDRPVVADTSVYGEPPAKRPESVATVSSMRSSQTHEPPTKKPESVAAAASQRSSQNSMLALSELWDSEAAKVGLEPASDTPQTSAAPSLMLGGDSSSASKKDGERAD